MKKVERPNGEHAGLRDDPKGPAVFGDDKEVC